MLLTWLTIKKYQIFISKTDRCSFLLKNKRNCLVLGQNNTIYLQINTKKLMNRNCRKKPKNRKCNWKTNIGKHMIMILFLGNIMINERKKIIRNKENSFKSCMELIPIKNYLHPMCIENLLWSIILNLYLKQSKD
jgi:hypothetical protein